jgi:hypothetical protein
MKYIAFYLPQYHVIPENDTWWGKGFTEWERVKNSKPVFKGHDQPRTPMNYYDLRDVNVMVNQSQLAKAHGISGFCYYHYWFNGKLLLEKPLEQMLVSKEVDIPFCLSWANEKWTRAWEGKSKEILIEQNYGDEKDWEKHLNYLIPFFNDERYITVCGMPVFLIYRTESFEGFDKMFSFWNERMKENGFKEIFFVEMLNSYQKKPKCKNSKGVVEFEPMFTIGGWVSINSIIIGYFRRRYPFLFRKLYKIFDYDKVWKKIILRRSNYENKTVFHGAFTDWDNTPRFNEKAAIFKKASPDKFKDYLLQQTKKADSELLFINAWNEWAEGAYLEPDKRFNYGFLNSVKSIVDGYPG